MMSEQIPREIALAPNEYALLSDSERGTVSVVAGPYASGLSAAETPVVFDAETGRYRAASADEARKPFASAPEGAYLVLYNPAKDGKQPAPGAAARQPELDYGRKTVHAGPLSVALWPGQSAETIEGHSLRADQYLLARYYDEAAASANLASAVVKLREGGAFELPEPAQGAQFVVRGADVAFFIPPAGAEVIADETGAFERDAVVLEPLEFCVLADESGAKRFVQTPGPAFPVAGETYLELDGDRAFRAYELDENSGVHVRVTAPYAENKKTYKEGEELFITGKDQTVYFPRPEHEIIPAGGEAVYRAIAVGEGEGRYVMNRKTGKVSLVKGPAMLLPDPREAIIVKRILSEETAARWFPNKRGLHTAAKAAQPLFTRQSAATLDEAILPHTARAFEEDVRGKASGAHTLTENYGKTLPTAYAANDEALRIEVPAGYAVAAVNKAGARRIIEGPQAVLLEYDEDLAVIQTSEGPSVRLKTRRAEYRDVVIVQASDYSEARIEVAYHVDFEGDAKKWFSVENPVELLQSRLRPEIRRAAAEHALPELYREAENLVREIIFGKSNDKDKSKDKNAGLLLEENGMRVFGIEVLSVTAADAEIDRLMRETRAQAAHFKLENERLRLQTAHQKETNALRAELLELQAQNDEQRLAAEEATKLRELEARKKTMELEHEVLALEAKLEKIRHDAETERKQKELDQQIEWLQAEVDAVVNKAKAVSPALVAALQKFSDRALAEKLAETMAPLAILGDKSIADVYGNLFEGADLGEALKNGASDAGETNGAQQPNPVPEPAPAYPLV